MKTLEQKNSVIDELEKLCDTAEWNFPEGSQEDPLDYGIHSKEESIKAWHIPKSTGQFLFFLVNLLQPKNILELGTSIGYSSLWMGAAAEQYCGHIDTLEYFEEKIKVAEEYSEKAGLQNVISIHREKIIDFLNESEVAYDFVFMDADKGNYKNYFDILKQKASKNCLIVVDNAGNFQHRMTEFIEACKNDPEVATSFLPFDNGLFLVQLGKKNSNLLNSFDLFNFYTKK